MRLLFCLCLTGCGFQETTTSDGGIDSKCPFFGAFGNFYCDGFEGGLNPAYLLTQVQSTVAVEPGRAYRGSSALHLHTNVYDGDINGYVDATAGANDQGPISFGAAQALRVFVFLPSPLVDGGLQLLSLGDLTVYLVNGIPTLTAQVANMPFPTDRWVCLELRSEPADMGSVQSLWLDDEKVAEEPNGVMLDPHDFGLKLVRSSQAAPAMDVWFDELVLDDQPILCDR